MEESFSKGRINISFRTCEVRMQKSQFCTLLFKNMAKYYLPDSSYGDWVFYENGKPTYYYSSFFDNGELKPLAQKAEQLKMEVPELVIKKVKKLTGKKVTIHQSSYFFLTGAESRVVTLLLEEILDSSSD